MIRLLEQHLGPLALVTPPPPTQLEQTIEHLSHQIDSLQARLRKLEAELSRQRYLTRTQSKRIAELEAGLALPVKDSHNSSLPPSTDGPAVKRTRSLRQSSGLRPGGQVGHAGRTRRLATQVDKVVGHLPVECKHCKADLATSEVVGDEKRQVIELPEIKLRVVEHRAISKRCSNCGGTTKGSFPKQARATLQYGARLRAVAVYLSQYQLLPYERTCQLMRDLFGCGISAGTLSNLIAKCAENLSKREGQIRGALLRSAVMPADETALRVGKQMKYVHVASTKKLTFLSVNQRRGRQAIDEIGIVGNFTGTLVHDCFVSYDGYGQCSHGLCCAHILRELIYQIEASPKQKQWAEPMKELMLEMKAAVDEAKAAGKKKLEGKQGRGFNKRYKEVSRRGWEINQTTKKGGGADHQHTEQAATLSPIDRQARALLQRMQLRQEQVLRFMTDFEVPFDNNQAERDLRMVKLKQKISGCFRADEGAESFCRIRGYVSTLGKRGHNIVEALEQACRGQPLPLTS